MLTGRTCPSPKLRQSANDNLGQANDIDEHRRPPLSLGGGPGVLARLGLPSPSEGGLHARQSRQDVSGALGVGPETSEDLRAFKTNWAQPGGQWSISPAAPSPRRTARSGRQSMALDLSEPVRPLVEGYVVDMVGARTFKKADFWELATGEVR